MSSETARLSGIPKLEGKVNKKMYSQQMNNENKQF